MSGRVEEAIILELVAQRPATLAELQLVETLPSDERAPIVWPTATWSSAWVTPTRQVLREEMSIPPKKSPLSVDEIAAFDVARLVRNCKMDVSSVWTSTAVALVCPWALWRSVCR